MSSAVSQTLRAYVARHVPAERVVAVVAEAYYGDRGKGNGDWLRSLVEIIERAHPGIVQLAGSPGRPGFAVQLAERPFPREFEPDLKLAVAASLRMLGEGGGDEGRDAGEGRPRSGVVARLVGAVRRLFSASA